MEPAEKWGGDVGCVSIPECWFTHPLGTRHTGAVSCSKGTRASVQYQKTCTSENPLSKLFHSFQLVQESLSCWS